MSYDQLINKKFLILQRNKILKDDEKFIFNEIANRLNSNIQGINLSLNNCLEIGFSTNKILNYINKEFKQIDYDILDLTKIDITNFPKNVKSILFDHDNWQIINKFYDIIVSNLFLHQTNNLNNLLKNINSSLNDNGFFIASIPGHNCFNELKNTFITTDIELYGGAYKRFIDVFSIDFLTQSLKNNNFKIPVIEIENLELRYKDFESLINDVRYLSNSYYFYDRKIKFEKKNYFKKAEEIYWQKFSRNNEIILSCEVVFFSGWKEHSSQQVPLKPGKAKKSLKEILN